MVFFEFLFWYYTKAPVEIWHTWRIFFLFFFDFFGFRYHLRTLFRPWHAMVLRAKGASPLQAFLFNLFARIMGSFVGFLARTVTMVLGLLTLLVSLVLLPSIELLWFSLPIIAVLLFIHGIGLF